MPEAEYWYHVFGVLHPSRGVGLEGPRTIPLSEIEAYCALFRISDLEDREELVTIIRAVDLAYLDLCEARKPKG